MHEGGVALSDINWVQAGTNETGRIEKVELTLPKGVQLTRRPTKPLSNMIASGELDCVIIARPPDFFARAIPTWCGCFPTFEAWSSVTTRKPASIRSCTSLRCARHSRRRTLDRRAISTTPSRNRNAAAWSACSIPPCRAIRCRGSPITLRACATIRRRSVSLRHRRQPADARAVPALHPRAGHRAQAGQAGGYLSRRHHGLGESLTICRRA